MSTKQAFVDWLWRLGKPVIISGQNAEALPLSFDDVRSEFEKMNAAICVPLNAKTKLIGLLLLGEKKRNRYTQEDIELLETVSNHSALAIQNLQLQEHIRQTTELESFYKFASFVIHDLRNTVSVLSMLADNAKIHLDDPEFRNNLKETLAGAVTQMKGMLSKVSMVSSSLSLSKVRLNVVELIEDVLQEVESVQKIEVVREYGSWVEIVADAHQLRKVIQNLILNAIEAMPSGGSLTIQVTHGGSEDLPARISTDWKVNSFLAISISDTGCGMSKEFIQKQLFKPFQTTKKKGLGIGLYHCREIIESHEGRIWAESEPNEGTCFIVALPEAAGEKSANTRTRMSNGHSSEIGEKERVA